MTEQQIQAYVMGELPPEEATLVAEELARNPTLAAVAEEYKTIKEGFRRQRVAKLQKDFLEFDKTLPPPPTPPSTSTRWFRNRFFIPFALVITLLLCGGLFAYIQTQNFSNDAIAHRYFNRPLNPNVASGNEEPNEVRAEFNRAVDKYFAGDYAGAREGFEPFLQSDSYRSNAIYYLPHTAFLLEDHLSAVNEFERAISNNELPEEDRLRLRWNKLMNDLALGEEIEAELDQNWPVNYSATEVKQALASVWHR